MMDLNLNCKATISENNMEKNLDDIEFGDKHLNTSKTYSKKERNNTGHS